MYTIHRKGNTNGLQIYEEMVTFTLKKNALKSTLYWYHFSSLRWTKTHNSGNNLQELQGNKHLKCSWLTRELPPLWRTTRKKYLLKPQQHSPPAHQYHLQKLSLHTGVIHGLACARGACHLPLQGLDRVLLAAAALQHPLWKPRVESRNEALYALGKRTRQIFTE